MCLIVKSVPTLETSNIPCYKELHIDLSVTGVHIYTPYFYMPVTSLNLKPKRQSKRTLPFRVGEAVNGGFIHAYLKKPKHTSLFYMNHNTKYAKETGMHANSAIMVKCLAKGVRAFGENGDLVCDMLEIDRLDLKKQVKAFIKQVAQKI